MTGEELTAAPSAPPPTPLGVQPVTHGGASQLACKGGNHVRRVDPVAGLGVDGEDGGAVGDLGGLHANIDAHGLENGAGDGEGADTGPHDDASQDDELGADDGEERDEAVDDAAVEGCYDDGYDGEEREQADGEGRVLVGRRGEEEGQGGPEGGENGGEGKDDEAGLDQDRFGGDHVENGPQGTGVSQAARVGGRVVGHERVEQEGQQVLGAAGEPVDVAPAGEVGNDTREETRDEHAGYQTAGDDGQGGTTTVNGGEVADERDHELGRDGGDATDEGDGAEGREGTRHAEGNPLLLFVHVREIEEVAWG